MIGGCHLHPFHDKCYDKTSVLDVAILSHSYHPHSKNNEKFNVIQFCFLKGDPMAVQL